MVKKKQLNLNKNYMIKKYNTKYINERIEAKLISKITYYRNKINEDFQLRHKAEYPELHYMSLKANIRNLKTWINQYRMINDTVDILDPYILNFGVEFVVKPLKMADKFVVLENCTDALRKHFSQPLFIGEALYISDIYEVLKNVTGVLDVIKVKVYTKSGGSYSTAAINIQENISPDGSYVSVPKNAIMELKYPDVDITGKIR